MLVTVATDDGAFVGVVEVDSHHGPWSDDWQCGKEGEFSELMNAAARAEGGE